MSLYLSVIIENSTAKETLCCLKPSEGTSFLPQTDVMVVYVVAGVFLGRRNQDNQIRWNAYNQFCPRIGESGDGSVGWDGDIGAEEIAGAHSRIKSFSKL